MTTLSAVGSGMLLSPVINITGKLFGYDVGFTITGNDPFFGILLLTFATMLAVFVLATDRWMPYFKEKLEYKQQFDRIKLINSDLREYTAALTKHRTYYNSYRSDILYKSGLLKTKNTERVAIDEKILQSLQGLTLYLPDSLRSLMGKIRMIISCDFQSGKDIYYSIYYDLEPLNDFDNISVRHVVDAALEIYRNYCEAYLEIAQMMLNVQRVNDEDVKNVLKKYNIGKDSISTNNGLIYRLAYQYILLPEYQPIGNEAGEPF